MAHNLINLSHHSIDQMIEGKHTKLKQMQRHYSKLNPQEEQDFQVNNLLRYQNQT